MEYYRYGVQLLCHLALGFFLGYAAGMGIVALRHMVQLLNHRFERPPVEGWKPVWVKEGAASIPAWLDPQSGEIFYDGRGIDMLDKAARARKPNTKD